MAQLARQSDRLQTRQLRKAWVARRGRGSVASVGRERGSLARVAGAGRSRGSQVAGRTCFLVLGSQRGSQQGSHLGSAPGSQRGSRHRSRRGSRPGSRPVRGFARYAMCARFARCARPRPSPISCRRVDSRSRGGRPSRPAHHFSRIISGPIAFCYRLLASLARKKISIQI